MIILNNINKFSYFIDNFDFKDNIIYKYRKSFYI